MTQDERFTLEEFGLNFIVNDNGRNLSAKKTVDLLNELHKENKLLKYIIMETLGVSDCEIEEELDRLRGDAE